MDSFTRNSNLFPAAFQVCLWIGTTHAQASIGISTAIDMMFGLTGRLDDGFALLRRNGSEDREMYLQLVYQVLWDSIGVT